jgi:hypothetical protein
MGELRVVWPGLAMREKLLGPSDGFGVGGISRVAGGSGGGGDDDET